MMEWCRVASLDELPLGRGKTVKANGKNLAIFHLNLGFFVLDDRCHDSDGCLARGKVEGHLVICLQHGCRFNIVSGECVDDEDIQLGTYRVKQDGPDLFVRIP